MSDRRAPERVLMLTDFFEPVIGGLELHVGMMSRELARRGHHVAIATLGRSTGRPGNSVDGSRPSCRRLESRACAVLR